MRAPKSIIEEVIAEDLTNDSIQNAVQDSRVVEMMTKMLKTSENLTTEIARFLAS